MENSLQLTQIDTFDFCLVTGTNGLQRMAFDFRLDKQSATGTTNGAATGLARWLDFPTLLTERGYLLAAYQKQRVPSRP